MSSTGCVYQKNNSGFGCCFENNQLQTTSKILLFRVLVVSRLTSSIFNSPITILVELTIIPRNAGKTEIPRKMANSVARLEILRSAKTVIPIHNCDCVRVA